MSFAQLAVHRPGLVEGMDWLIYAASCAAVAPRFMVLALKGTKPPKVPSPLSVWQPEHRLSPIKDWPFAALPIVAAAELELTAALETLTGTELEIIWLDTVASLELEVISVPVHALSAKVSNAPAL